jgi:hypothetical protein
VPRRCRLRGRRRLRRIFQQRRPAAYIAGWFLDAEGGAGAGSCRCALPSNNGVARVSRLSGCYASRLGSMSTPRCLSRGWYLPPTGLIRTAGPRRLLAWARPAAGRRLR